VGQIGALTSHWLIKEKKIKEAHNPEVAGSNPAPATMKTRLLTGFLIVDLGRSHNPKVMDGLRGQRS